MGKPCVTPLNVDGSYLWGKLQVFVFARQTTQPPRKKKWLALITAALA